MIDKTLSLAMVVLLLAACQPKSGSDQGQGEASRPEAAPAHVPAPPVGAMDAEPLLEPAVQRRNTMAVDTRILDVRLSDNGNPEEGLIGAAKTSFNPKDTVYVSVETDGSAKEYTLYAKWVEGAGEVLSEYGITVDQPGRQRRVLSLSKPDGWLPGRHSVELTINDGDTRKVDFDVVPSP